MTDVERLLRTYIERFEQGGASDPSDVLEQADAADRPRLAALIEGYLEHEAPVQAWDAKAFKGSVAERAVAMLEESWAAEAADLPQELVSRRHKAKLKRSELVAALAKAIGASKQEQKVAVYYNALEHGRLEPRGVSSKVFEALAKILDTSSDALRKAGESVAPSTGGEPGTAYARLTRADAEMSVQALERLPDSTPDEATEEDWDAVDRLFRGGGSTG